MKIIVYDNSGHPFQVQLSRALAKNGFDVLHLFSASFQTPKGSLEKKESDPTTFSIRGIRLSEEFKKYSFISRWRQENIFGSLVINEIKGFNPDVIIASNVPLDTLKHIVRYCQSRNIRLIFWVQDFYGIAIKKILQSKLPVVGRLIGLYYIAMERRLLENSNHIILISEEFQDVLAKMKVTNNNITVIPNWSPIDEIPTENKENVWSIEHKLNEKFCFTYTGTLGLKHNPELLLELAKHYQNNDLVRVIVISEGIGANWLKENIAIQGINNLIILPFQPFGVLPKVMATADVLISILEKDAGIYSVPSKILSYLCAHRPLLLAVPIENLSAKIVTESNSGIVVPPDQKEEFIKAAEILYADKTKRAVMGENARQYAEKYFEICKITKQFVQIINNTKGK